jgi:ATP-dependent Lon protease
MKKDKVTMFAEESYNDLDDNIGIVMPILTDCDVDEDFTEGMEKAVEELTVGDIENFVDKLIKSENRFEILMLPE